MAVKKYKPTSDGRRGMMGYDFSTLDKKDPEKSLLGKKTRKVGRGSAGKITIRHRGGGAKKRFRMIDFRMNKFDIPAKVQAIEYDPNRTSFIALVAYADGEKRYIIALEGLKKEDKIISSESAPIKIGNRMSLKNIPSGTIINNIELFPGKGGQLARSAGSYAKLTAIEGGYAHVSLSSGQVKLIPENSFATIGQVSNISHNKVVIGKAGRSRWMGKRPQVRGSAMNPVDHPHGGGEGRQPIGLKHPKTPWGKPALGFKTRKKNKRINNFKKRIEKTEEE
ncbi:MAG: 50S ribosomal protein L2 [Candidatus Andersenbacteria bacterium]|nr:50S ribosomal protein L2 [Candidatus Andersenbacteria bacterium]